MGISTLILIALSAPAVAAHDPGSGATCAEVYFVRPQGGIGPFNDPVMEISIGLDGAKAKPIGKLFRRDWGALKACGRTMTVRIRSIGAPNSVNGPTVGEILKEHDVDLIGRDRIYFEVGTRWSEIPVEAGASLLGKIESRLGPPSPTGWGWEDRRHLYYGESCLSPSERCP